MQKKELELTGTGLYYEKHKDYIEITRVQGFVSQVQIPEVIEELPVKILARKAFLSHKQIRRVSLPDTLTEIGDWCFAYCNQLEQVVFPKREITFGKAVFLECDRLSKLVIEGEDEGVAALLAAATQIDAYYLLNVMEAGTEEWLTKWDARMLDVLHRPDQEGFSRQVLCGEEDYGSTDLNAFMESRRRDKVRLLLLRRLYNRGLAEGVRIEIEQYLQEHTKGCESEETWQVLLQEHGNDSRYYQLFTELSCVTEDNFGDILKDMGEDYPEMKAYFMKYKDAQIGYFDFFGELEL
ncbi:MAG: leucine-rich repeat protein [Lachnospiraceae bacterium]|nr:leucine-rich repeat protein [Lachnospiraceae bacterium]